MAFLNDWSFRREITVTEQKGDSVTDYPLNAVVDIGTASSDSIRVTSSDGTTTVTHGHKQNSGSQYDVSWRTNLNSGETKTFYIYYGNSGASNTNSGWYTTFFDHYYDFETDQTGDFQVNDCGITACSISYDSANNRMQFSTDNGYIDVSLDPSLLSMENMHMYIDHETNYTDTASGGTPSGTGIISENYLAGKTVTQGPYFSWVDGNEGIGIDDSPDSNNYHNGNVTVPSSRTKWDIYKDGGDIKWDKDGTQVDSQSVSYLESAQYVPATKVDYTNSITHTHYWYELGIRKYVSPEPSINVGSEQTGGVTLSGNVKVNSSNVENAEVLVYNKTTSSFVGKTSSDSNGDWSLTVSGGSDTYAVSYFYDDGTTYWASAEQTDLA